MVAQPLGQRLGQLAAGAVVGQHLVAARPLDGGRERPRPGDLGLERAGVALAACSSTASRSCASSDRGPAVVDPGGVGEPPARPAAGRRRGRRPPPAPDRSSTRSRRGPGSSGTCGRPGSSAEHHPHRLGVRLGVLARIGPHRGRQHAGHHARERRYPAIVARHHVRRSTKPSGPRPVRLTRSTPDESDAAPCPPPSPPDPARARRRPRRPPQPSGISPAQIAGSALAAVSAAFFASWLGVTGTLIGAALRQRGRHRRQRDVHLLPAGQPPGRTPAGELRGGRSSRCRADPEVAGWRALPWPRIALGTGAVLADRPDRAHRRSRG